MDPIQHIREHVGLYIPGGEPRAEYLTSRLALDALTLGVRDVTIKRGGDWWLVHGTTDWLRGTTEEEIRKLFTNIVPFPEAGVNSMRSEVLITAFARDVATAKETHRIVIAGDIGPHDPLWRLPGCGGSDRVVAFRF